MNDRSFIRIVYLWLLSGYYYKVLKKNKYDVVHIHGCGFADEILMDVCRRVKQPFVITLHGLNSFSDTVNISSAGKKYERDFLRRVTDGDFPITVISSGIKHIIENTYKVKDCQNVFVVCNSFSFNDKAISKDKISIKEQYKIKEDSTIILYVGNICQRKNQGQLIKSFDYLPEELANKTYVLFLGREIEDGYSITSLSKGSKYEQHFIACGVVEKDMVSCYYLQGNAVALMSLSEGFGLSLIEGMHFGLPAISFTDIDAYEDIYDEQSMVGVVEHTDKAVAEGLKILLEKHWDKERIKAHSKSFEADNMAKRYVEVYNKIVQLKSTN